MEESEAMKGEYVRGWRQITAVYYALWCLFKGEWLGLKRELHIMTGFAKPYGVRIAPSFWEACKENLGMSDKEVQEFKDEIAQKYGSEALEKK